MQPMKYLNIWLDENTINKNCLFTLQDFRSLFPNLNEAAFKTLLSRSVLSGILKRICRGVYCYKRSMVQNGFILFHTAALLRADSFNYISLETALSDAGVISQVPINYISIMSSGRSGIINCGEFGTIEFVHTNQTPSDIISNITYDYNCRLWRANIIQAIRDMKATHRNSDLIDWDIVNEII